MNQITEGYHEKDELALSAVELKVTKEKLKQAETLLQELEEDLNSLPNKQIPMHYRFRDTYAMCSAIGKYLRP
jgi:outer membrane PBP1 activator LpoA protein